jgi:uncharacterized protein (UPF0332 family)
VIEEKFFKKHAKNEKEITDLLANAERSLHIAEEDRFLEVRFSYTYKAFIQSGMALLNHHGLRVRSIPGHHSVLIQKISELLSDEDVCAVGDVMRKKRNRDLYFASVEITEKECEEYLDFVRAMYSSIRAIIRKK